MAAYQQKATCMHEYLSSPRVWGLSCPGSPEEVARARRWTRDVLRESPCADDAALIVTELSTNAVLHTHTDVAADLPPGAFHVSLAVSEALVSISVTDSGGTKTAPTVEHPDADETHGRGLAMVTALAHHVETHVETHGHTVTAHLTTAKDAS
jgi:anti-sigma regulatory factor (Ser/Thr protein kinase)